MAQTCSKCSRSNPVEAAYCYYDGSLLEGHSQNGGPMKGGMQSFPSQFVFPNGLICRNFDQLAQACQENWPSAVDLLQQGYLENFLGGLGRADLAFAAREASRFPDRDRGLDQLLAKLPSQVLDAPKLKATPHEVNLGLMEVGANRQLELHLENNGSRLLYGSVASDDCKWLTLGDAPGTPSKVFQFGHELVIPIQVRGANLRAGNKPLEGKLLIESNGGNTAVVVRCEVPVKAFPAGVLAGAKSPRQIAEKARAAPREAALLFEMGTVADWYKSNGWTYPVQGPSAAGLGAVQQFFEALGLTAPPKVEINEKSISFQGNAGQSLKRSVEVKAQEKRPVFAHAVSDQPWLVAERHQLSGRTAVIAITVPSVPNRPSEVLQGQVTITSNGNQRFVVPVTLSVGGTPLPYSQPAPMDGEAFVPVFAEMAAAPAAIMAAPLITGTILPGRGRPATMPATIFPDPIPLTAEPIPLRRAGKKKPLWLHLIPTFLIAAALLTMVILDLLLKPATEDEDYPVDPHPFVKMGFLDHNVVIQGNVDNNLGSESRRFGWIIPDQPDPNGITPENPTGKKRLTFFPEGTSNNTCVSIDGQESLLGSTPRGRWIKSIDDLGTAEDGPPEKKKRKRLGNISTFYYPEEKIQITQHVEIVPNPQPTTVKGKEVRRLDTVLVLYTIENKAAMPRKVGLRFLLDTFIGANDGVPFTIPGKSQLCNTKEQFTGDGIPQYIEALENGDIKNPGTVAHLALRIKKTHLPGTDAEVTLDQPSRVTLGAWPHSTLKELNPKARGHMTMWDVPFLDMKSLNRNDSAVTIYWDPKTLEPKEKREVGFAYGEGNFEGDSGKIGIGMDGQYYVGGEITVNAEIAEPKDGESATIQIPEGYALVNGDATQKVPPAEAGKNRSSVTWIIRPSAPGKGKIKVTSSSGGSQTKPINIKTHAGIFG